VPSTSQVSERSRRSGLTTLRARARSQPATQAQTCSNEAIECFDANPVHPFSSCSAYDAWYYQYTICSYQDVTCQRICAAGCAANPQQIASEYQVLAKTFVTSNESCNGLLYSTCDQYCQLTACNYVNATAWCETQVALPLNASDTDTTCRNVKSYVSQMRNCIDGSTRFGNCSASSCMETACGNLNAINAKITALAVDLSGGADTNNMTCTYASCDELCVAPSSAVRSAVASSTLMMLCVAVGFAMAVAL